MNNRFSSSSPPSSISVSLNQVYFILVIYSLALHLRRGTFRQLLSSQLAAKASSNTASSSPLNRRASQSANGYAYSHLRDSSNASTALGHRQSADLVFDTEANNDREGNEGELSDDEELRRAEAIVSKS